MKWYHWLIIGVIGYVVLFRKKGTTATGGHDYAYTAAIQAAQAAQDAETLATINALGNPDAGFYGPTTHLTPAYTGSGWNPYPGWFRTDDGGWVNPDTGGTFSQDSSPEALPEPASYNDPLVIDLNVPVLGQTTTPSTQPYFIA